MTCYANCHFNETILPQLREKEPIPEEQREIIWIEFFGSNSQYQGHLFHLGISCFCVY